MYLLLVPINPTNNDSRYRFAPGAPVFATLDFARTYLEEGIDDHTFGPDVTIHEWLGEVRNGQPIFAGDPLASDALFLALPHHGAGTRDEHRPLLKLAEDVIGQGLPLDALAGHDSGDPDDWRILDDDRGEVIEVEVAVAIDNEGWRHWRAEAGHPDDVIEAAEDFVDRNGYPPNDDAEEGDAGDTVYAAIFDGEVIGCYDDPYDAETAIGERRSESRYGCPWAWNWAYYLDYPPDSKVIAAIKAAGYTVAEQTATGYLFAGIDGGGYDFDSAHKAPLGAALAHLWYQLIDGAIPVGPAL